MNMRIRAEAGNILVIVPISLLLAVGLVVATLAMTTSNLEDTYRETRRVRAYYVAKAGLEQEVFDLKQATSTAVLVNAFSGVQAFHDKKTYSDSLKMQSLVAGGVQSPAVDPGSGGNIDAAANYLAAGVTLGGTFDVSLHVEGYDPANPGVMSNTRRFVTIRSTGYVPRKGAPNVVAHTIETTVLLELTASEVFDYAYFINNWGWFYGNTIEANGNVRSNGQFDAGGYSCKVNGSPRYVGANGTDLYGYIDDNEDGLQDGNDGGIFAGWDIIGTQNVTGMAAYQSGGEFVNQHDYTEQVDMPNLTDLSIYEAHAIANNSSISIGGTQVCDAVYGDDVGEHQDLVLIGTAAAPIVLNGTVVVRGNVIIKGKVSGQGVIYSGDNVYVADDVTYVDGPATKRPAGNDEASFESWMVTNQSKDALGLFAREHVVLGNYTDSTWRSYVNSWMGNSANQSKEDAGEDGIPNTRRGLDGILNTSDDDVLEGDGVWTTEQYTALHEALGLIPAGKAVGDAIPGTGEDIDGDGAYDGAFTLSQFDLPYALNSGMYGGNLPAGITAFSQISSNNIAQFDAAMYTNHALAGMVLNWGGDIAFNGCVVSRNESIIYGANKLQINHDARLIGGGDNFGYYLPRTFRQIRFMKTWDSVPNIHFDEVAAQQGVAGY